MPAGERALRVVAGGSLQPSRPDPRAEGGCRRRRTPDDPRASRGGDGADRHRRPVSRDQRRDARPGADGGFRLPDRWTGGRAPAGACGHRRGRPASRSAGSATISNRPAACAPSRWPKACRSISTTGNFASRARVERSSRRRTSRASARTSSRPSARTLLRGRTITAEDRIMAAPVAVISEPLAEQLFPGTEPIGERVTVTLDESREQEFTIVGVTADFATSQLTTDAAADPAAAAGLSTSCEGGAAPTVHLIARGAPGDEPKLKVGAGECASRAGRRAVARRWRSPASSPGRSMVEKSMGDLISESTAVGSRRRSRADPRGARHRRRRGLHGGDAHARDRRSDGAGLDAPARVPA